MRPLFSSILAHVASSYVGGVAFIGLGYWTAPEGMSRSATPSGWATTLAGSPLVFPVAPVFVLTTDGAYKGVELVYVWSLVVYAVMLLPTYFAFRRIARRETKP
jgi:hypothetical protein